MKLLNLSRHDAVYTTISVVKIFILARKRMKDCDVRVIFDRVVIAFFDICLFFYEISF